MSKFFLSTIRIFCSCFEEFLTFSRTYRLRYMTLTLVVQRLLRTLCTRQLKLREGSLLLHCALGFFFTFSLLKITQLHMEIFCKILTFFGIW